MLKYMRGGLIIAFPLLLVIYYLADPSTLNIFPRCVFHAATGLYCPGCGSQRALHGLLHLNPSVIISNNILFLPAFLLIGYNYTHRLLNKLLALKLPDVLRHRSTPWIILVVIMLFWILRNLPYYPFANLAPV